MKLIDHLTNKEIVGIPSRQLRSYYIENLINKHLTVTNGDDVRYYLITGHVYSTPDYCVLYELTKRQYDNRVQIHEILV